MSSSPSEPPSEAPSGPSIALPAEVPARRMLLVHAHPDDETIGTGATMAHYAGQGAGVTLITCTRGEQGEVIPAELAHLAADRDDTLGVYRVGELAAAMAALGVSDHRFLDELPAAGTGATGDGASSDRAPGDRAPGDRAPGDGAPGDRGPGDDVIGTADAPVYRDSGMTVGVDGVIGLPDDARPNAFARADLDRAAARLAELIKALRPQVLVTYDPGGGYGHPDHVQAHRVAMRAVELAADGGWHVPKVYWTGVPRTAILAAMEHLEGTEGNPFAQWSPDRMPSMVMPDELVTTVIDGTGVVDRKADALRAHATQIAVDGPFFALSNAVGQPLVGREYFRLVQGTPAGERDADGRETDLFAGVA